MARVEVDSSELQDTETTDLAQDLAQASLGSPRPTPSYTGDYAADAIQNYRHTREQQEQAGEVIARYRDFRAHLLAHLERTSPASVECAAYLSWGATQERIALDGAWQLVLGNTRFIMGELYKIPVAVAILKNHNPRFTKDDLLGELCMRMVEMADQFDPALGNFQGFIKSKIRYEVNRIAGEQSLAFSMLPQDWRLRNAVLYAAGDLARRGLSTTIEAITKRVKEFSKYGKRGQGLSPQRVRGVYFTPLGSDSLDTISNIPTQSEKAATDQSLDQYSKEQMLAALATFLEANGRELDRDILLAYLDSGDSHTLEKASERLGIPFGIVHGKYHRLRAFLQKENVRKAVIATLVTGTAVVLAKKGQQMRKKKEK